MSAESDKLKIERDITAQIKEQTAELLKQARDRQDMSTTMAGYLEALKKIKAINKTIADNEKLITELQKDSSVEAQNAWEILKHQTDELKAHGKILTANIKEVNKGTLMMVDGFKTGAKAVGVLPGIFKSVYAEIKKLGGLEMDKAIKTSALQMGILSKESESFASSIQAAANSTIDFGVGIEDLAKLQANYSDNLGRAVKLTGKGLEAMGEMAAATGLGAEGAAKFASDMDNIGISAEGTRDFINQTMDDAHKMGLNSSKVIKNIAGNIKMLNKYNFKGGIKGLAKMAETTTKLGVDMNFVGGMADKLFDIEGAVDMSAQLQVLGGAWAKMADPFKLMYMARNDMAGLATEVAEAASASAHFNKETKTFEVGAMEMDRLRKVAAQTGLNVEEVVASAKKLAAFKKIKTQINFQVNDPKTQEFLENTAQFNEKGEATINIDGKDRLMNALSDTDKKRLEEIIGEQENLKQRAKDSQTFGDSISNIVKQFEQLLLPIVQTMDKNLKPVIAKFSDILKDPKTFQGIMDFAKGIGSFISGIAKFVVEWPTLTLGLTVGLGVVFEAAKWYANGLALGIGFNMSTGKGGFMDSIKNIFSKGSGAFGGKGGKYGETGGQIGPAEPTKGGGMGGAKGFFNTAGKVGLAMSAIDIGVDAFKNASDENLSTTDKILKTLDENKGKIALGVLGALLAPLTGGLSIAAAAGLGATLGSGVDAVAPEFGSYGKPIDDGILSQGKITPINRKDDLLAMKPNGPIANSMSATQPANMKIDFGEIRIRCDELKVTSPGSPSLAIDLMKDPTFLRNLTRAIHVETDRVVQGGKSKG